MEPKSEEAKPVMAKTKYSDLAQISPISEQKCTPEEEIHPRLTLCEAKSDVPPEGSLKGCKRKQKLRAKAGPLNLTIPKENQQLRSLLASEVIVYLKRSS